jgi:hypothetical protein
MDDRQDDTPPFRTSPAGIALVVAAAVGGFYLVTEHRAHLYGILPYLFLLACPLMHVFMHRGHGHGGHRHREHGPGGLDEQPPH